MKKEKNLPTFDIENQYEGIVAGIDEAGRGPLAGPVVAACAIIDREKYPKAINDSKKLTEKIRENIYGEILELEDKGFLKYGEGWVFQDVIDEINIRQATMLAMKKSYENLLQKYDINNSANSLVSMVLVDGNFVPEIDTEKTKAKYIIKGDAKSLSIATASIIAKVSRDRYMLEIAKKYPEYGWRTNKGYGTKAHLAAIDKNGLTPHHRCSFTKIQGSLF